MEKLVSGTVSWFNSQRGIGYIEPDDGGEELFVHYKQINNTGYGRNSLERHQRVIFKVVQGEKGSLAENVIGL